MKTPPTNPAALALAGSLVESTKLAAGVARASLAQTAVDAIRAITVAALQELSPPTGPVSPTTTPALAPSGKRHQ